MTIKTLSAVIFSMLCASVVLIPMAATAQAVPANATADKYSFGGWKCDKGFKKTNTECLEIVVPENASLSPYDFLTGWKCHNGYIKRGAKCAKIDLPAHASLSPYDVTHGWKCDAGFKKNKSKCDKIDVPANASLNVYSFEDGWSCNTGFRKVGDQCAEIELPTNASYFVNAQGWQCDQYFKQVGALCKAMNDAERAEYDELIKQFLLEAAARRAGGYNNQDCDTEADTDSEVCVRVISAELDCTEDYQGNFYDSCEVEVEYVVETDYSGSGSIDATIKCEVEVEYEGEASYGSSDESFRKYETLYGGDSNRRSEDVDFSFYYEEPTSVEVSEVKCQITDLSR